MRGRAVGRRTCNAVNTYVYDPYGNPLAGTTEAVANPWQFAGGFRDAFSGYYKFGTRYYDPTIGRWTQPDPSGLEANNYLYAAANPVNFVDPTGMFWSKAWEHTVFSYGGCALVCGTGTLQGGHASLSWGCCGAMYRGWGIGYSNLTHEQREPYAVGIAGAYGVGAYALWGSDGQLQSEDWEVGVMAKSLGGWIGFQHNVANWNPRPLRRGDH